MHQVAESKHSAVRLDPGMPAPVTDAVGIRRAISTGRVEIQDLTKRFALGQRSLIALQSIELAIEAGEFLTIVGTSGCGKSTLLRLVAGLDAGSSGCVVHDGQPVAGPSLDRGLVFQEARLMPWLTVAQNIALALQNSAMTAADRRAAVAEHIALVGLRGFENAYPHQLSGGMAQRAAIARGLVNRPGVLLLDEPFGALDALTRARLQDELLRIWADERITMVLVTHDVDEAIYLGDRVVVMSPRPGRIKRISKIALPRPRDRAMPAFSRLRSDVLSVLEGASDTAPHPTVDTVQAVLTRGSRNVFDKVQGASL